ncbi:MAG: glycosyltransferase family 39 protein [Actinobacteria bacterium]|nr:glycosyltransferase family 39 protein [Actinomycetota bacterium]
MERLAGLYNPKSREYALVLVFFLLVAILFTWPLVLHLHDGIVGGHGDPLLNSWIISWDARTIFTNPAGLFQGNIIYPSRDVLAYSEHQFTLGVIAAPVYLVFHNPILAYNFLIFFCIIFSGFGCYLLIKELTGSRWGALAGGLFFALCPYKISQFSHIQIFFSPFLPFMLLYLYRFLERGRWRNLVLFVVFFVAQSLSSWHYLLYSAMAAGLLWLWTAIFSRRKKDWIRLVVTAAAVGVAALIILPFTLPYFRAHERLPGFERTREEVELYGAKAEDYLRVLDVSVLYGDAPSPFKEGGIGYENVLWPGLMILILAAAGLLLRRREEDDHQAFDPASFRRGALFFLILGVLSALLAFGPKIGGWDNPFYMIPYNLGLLQFTRVPTRFFLLVAISLGVLGGYGVARLAMRASSGRDGGWRVGRLAGIGLLVLLLLELLTWNLYVYPIPVGGEVPDVYDWLAEQGDVAVIELPTHALGPAGTYDNDLKLEPIDIFEYLYREGDIMYFSTYHWKKVVNGYSGYSPFFYRRTITEMQGFPSRRSVDLLRGLGVEYVLWDWYWVPSERMEEYNVRLFSTPGLSHVEDFDNKSVFRVEEGDTALPEEMEVAAVAPAAVPAGEGFGMGLLVSNPAQAPMVCVEEEWQRYRLTCKDGTGKVAAEVQGDYRPPFFIDGGEAVTLPVEVEKGLAAGSYELELELSGGVLGDRDFDLAIEVREMPVSTAPGTLAGGVFLETGGQALNVPSPDGLYPLATAKLKNTGDTLWRALPQLGDLSLPPGEVHLGLAWTEADGSLWEYQGCSLPCDVSPGQEVEVPMLVRPPAAPGEYTLQLQMYAEGIGWFGDAIQVQVSVGGWTDVLTEP